MKYIVALIIMVILGQCSLTEEKKEKMLGSDIMLFKGTPVWDLAQAIEKDDVIKIRKFMEGKPSSLLNYKEKRYGQSLLQWAVYTNHYPSVKILLELGADPNLKSNDSTSAIIHAADKFETSDYLKLLVQHGGNVNIVADIKEAQHLRTPLMAAAFKSLENVKILIDAGADANYVDTTNGIQNALTYAFDGDKIDIVKYLIVEVGVDYKKVLNITIEGDSLYAVDYLRGMLFPLESEEYKQKMEVVNFLKEKGMDYWKTAIPSHYFKNYDSAYLEKY